MGYLIYCRMGSTTLGGLARQIGEMRNATRKTHKDVFTNTKVISWMYNWLDKLPVLKAGPNQQVAAVEWEGEDPESSTSLAKKRKRALREEEEDPDYRGAGAGSKTTGRANGSASKTTRSAAHVPATTRPAAPPPPSAVRPSLSGMDAAPIGHNVNPSFGQVSQPDPRLHNVSLICTHVMARSQLIKQRHNGIYGPPSTQPATHHAGGYQQHAQARASSSSQPQWAQHNVFHYQRR